MPYTVAVALIHGGVEERHFGERYLRDPQIRALVKRVKVKATEEADARMPDAMLCRMEIVTSSGQRFQSVVEYHRGHWKNPMSQSEVEAKFTKLAADVLKPEQGARLLEALWRLEELTDAGEIVRLTTPA
jgi:2-methylcitrate dehydratase